MLGVVFSLWTYCAFLKSQQSSPVSKQHFSDGHTLPLSRQVCLPWTCLLTRYGVDYSAVKWEAVRVHWFLGWEVPQQPSPWKASCTALNPLENGCSWQGETVICKLAGPDTSDKRREKPLNGATGVDDVQPVRLWQSVEASRAASSKEGEGELQRREKCGSVVTEAWEYIRSTRTGRRDGNHGWPPSVQQGRIFFIEKITVLGLFILPEAFLLCI